MANKKHTTDPEKDEEIKSSSSRGSSLLTDLNAQAEESAESNASSQKKQTQAQKNRMQSFFIAGSALVVAIVGIFGVAIYNNNQNSEQADASTPTTWIHRFYKRPQANARHVENHYYTNNINQVWTDHGTRNHTAEHYGYRFEGTRFGLYRANGTSCPSNTRMLNVYWTSDGREDHALGFTAPSSQARYNFAERLGCIATRRISGTVPLYHYWDVAGRNNFYTTDINESVLIAPGNRRSGVIIGYVIPRTNARPVYEFYNSRGQDHYYTTDMNDSVARRTEYVFQGSPFMVYDYNNVTEQCAMPNTSPLMVWNNSSLVNHYYRILDAPGVRPTHERTLNGWGYQKVMESGKHKALGCIRTTNAANFKPLHNYFNGRNHHYTTLSLPLIRNHGNPVIDHRYTNASGAGSIIGYVN